MAFGRNISITVKSDFSDVKITILGDSITTANNLDDEEKAKYSVEPPENDEEDMSSEIANVIFKAKNSSEDEEVVSDD